MTERYEARTAVAAQPMPASIKETIIEALIFRHDAGEDQDACDNALNWLSQHAAPVAAQTPDDARDAARYRWLRDPCSDAERVIFYCRGDYGRGLMSGSMLDAAIDAAMQRTSGREGEQWTPTQAYVHAAIGNWMRSGDTGTSSETMAAIALGADSGDFGAPYDPSDFGRCYRLVQAIPAIRDAFPRIAELVPAFAGILREWDALVAIYLRDLPSGKSGELYQRIKTLRTMSNSPGEGEQ